jgi:glycosyltransferase involved in cell wall biosynthesis
MLHGYTIGLIIPALNEEEAIGPLLCHVNRRVVDWVVVADNGSTDQTDRRARERGALVVHEPTRGYGSACHRALSEAPDADVIVFMDGDGSDDPGEIESLVQALLSSDSDLVIGSRVLGMAERGALTPVQRFGNAVTCALVKLLWGKRYTDLGPFRAIRKPALDRLRMSDPDFGWTIEMQVKAAQERLDVLEVPVTRRVRQGGQSKVSGNLVGSWRAGKRILSYVVKSKMRELTERTKLANSSRTIERVQNVDPENGPDVA